MRRVVVTAIALCATVLQVPLARAHSIGVDHVAHPADNRPWDHHVPTSTSFHPELRFTLAAGGPFGIDHRVHFDNRGLWNRNVQKGVMYGTVAAVIGGAFAFGDHHKLGDTFWRSLDAITVSSAAALVLKVTFQRERPSLTSDPNHFFSGIHHDSFPSGEVTAISAAVTPFIVRYGSQHPAVYLLAALPLYDAIARVKTHGHWQSDVLAGAVLGTAVGIWATHRQQSLVVGWLPGGFSVGYIHRF